MSHDIQSDRMAIPRGIDQHRLARRRFASAAVAAIIVGAVGRAMASPVVEVYKSASCGCCGKWIDHLRAAGFAVRAVDVPEPSLYREKLGVPQALGSCHTATVGGYVLEGHVPAREVRRLLSERPRARGLAVPSMPPGSPGMEGPPPQPYQVLLFDATGRTSVFARYPG